VFLRMRLMKKSKMRVVLKTLMLFHHCILLGDDLFVSHLKYKRNYFDLQKYHPLFKRNDTYRKKFIIMYGKYISQKLNNHFTLGYQFEKQRNSLKENNNNMQDTIKKVSLCQNQFNSLCNCMINIPLTIDEPCIQFTFNFLLKDGVILYSMLYEVIGELAPKIWDEDLQNSKKLLKIMKNFANETKAIKNIFQKFYTKTATYRTELNFYKSNIELFEKAMNFADVKEMEKHVEEKEAEFKLISINESGKSETTGTEKKKKVVNKKKKKVQKKSNAKSVKKTELNTETLDLDPQEPQIFENNPFRNMISNPFAESTVTNQSNPFL